MHGKNIGCPPWTKLRDLFPTVVLNSYQSGGKRWNKYTICESVVGERGKPGRLWLSVKFLEPLFITLNSNRPIKSCSWQPSFIRWCCAQLVFGQIYFANGTNIYVNIVFGQTLCKWNKYILLTHWSDDVAPSSYVQFGDYSGNQQINRSQMSKL